MLCGLRHQHTSNPGHLSRLQQAVLPSCSTSVGVVGCGTWLAGAGSMILGRAAVLASTTIRLRNWCEETRAYCLEFVTMIYYNTMCARGEGKG
eukprot:2228455-Pyramimonas_sp.AAC.1